MSRRGRRNDWIPGAVITIIVIMLSVVFMGLLAMTKMIPTIYMLIIPSTFRTLKFVFIFFIFS